MKIRRHIVFLVAALATSVLGATVGVTTATSASPAPAVSVIGGTSGGASTNSYVCLVWLPWLCF